MSCFNPLEGYQADRHNGIVFSRKEARRGAQPIQVPCGQCIGCLLERSRVWAMRCVFESQLHDNNCFVTLTYRDERNDGNLHKDHFQKFMKRLRKKFVGVDVRYFMCGEYGDLESRPHYHACLFGLDFVDRQLLKDDKGHRLYISPTLTDLWIDPEGEELPMPSNWIGHYNPKSYGMCTIGDVTFDSASYVARYTLKKLEKLTADERYKVMVADTESRKDLSSCTGDDVKRLREYVLMSRRPAIGKRWIEYYYKDVYPHDFVVIRNGVKCKPGKYFDSRYELLTSKELLGNIKDIRKQRAEANPGNSKARLWARGKVKKIQSKQLRREL